MKINEVIIREGVWDSVKDFAARQGWLGTTAKKNAVTQELRKEREAQAERVKMDSQNDFISKLKNNIKNAMSLGSISKF